MPLPQDPFPVGTYVEKHKGDYRFVGVVVSSFKKLSGCRRYVVEDKNGILHIYSAANLRVYDPYESLCEWVCKLFGIK